MNTRSALLVGSSGLVGRHLLQLLLDDDAYTRVTVLVRKPQSIRHPKLRECVVNFDHLERHHDVVHGDDAFCCLGTTIKAAGSQEAFRKVDFTYVVRTAALASKNGAAQFLMVSSLGADPNSSEFYSRVKGEVEHAVATLPFNAIHIFRPSFLLGKREEFRLGEKAGIILTKLLSFALVGRLRKYRAVRAQTVAKAMVVAAKRQQAGVNIIESDRIQALSQS